MWSMTGYGKGTFEEEGVELTCEMKTVNNRYLDVTVKAPRIFSAYEEIIRTKVREKMTRGHVDLFISFKDKREKDTALTIDMAVASSYVAAAKQMKEAFPDLMDDITLSSVLRYPDVLKQDDVQTLDETLINALYSALEQALENLNAMRLIEGEKLQADMLARVDTIETLVGQIEKRAPRSAQEHKDKIFARVQEYLNGANIDEGRILTEVAVFADKSNIDEELTRLHSHVAQFREICKEGVVGRKLDFLVQEFNREANTTCSKSNDVEITKLGLALKNEIEKIREQVQNIE